MLRPALAANSRRRVRCAAVRLCSCRESVGSWSAGPGGAGIVMDGLAGRGRRRRMKKSPPRRTATGISIGRVPAGAWRRTGKGRGLEAAHAAHATHAAHVGHRSSGLVFDDFGHGGFGGQQQAGDRGSVLQRGAGDLGRVDHALFDQVAVLAGGGVVAVVAFALFNRVDDHAGFVAGIGDDGAQRGFDGAQDQLDAGVLVGVVALDLGHGGLGADQRNTAARDDAFLDGRTRGVQGVFDAGLLFLHFDFGGRAHADHRHAAGQLGHAFLQLFTVVVRGGFLDLRTDLLDAGFDVLGIAGAVEDGGVFLGHFDALGLALHVEVRLFLRQVGFFGDYRAARQDGGVFQHGLAAVAEARGLDGGGLQDAADVVHDQGGQGFALDVLGHDQQRAAGLGDLFQHRQQVADVADLLVEDQDERVIQHGDLLVGVVDEVGRQVAAVELHAFDDVQLVVQGLAVFDGDDAFLADLVHRVGDDFTDGGVAVGRDRTDLGDGLAGGAGLGQLVQFVDGSDHGLVDAALQVHGADAGGHVLQAFFDDGLGQHGGGGGAVTGVVGGLGGDFLDQLGADVLE